CCVSGALYVYVFFFFFFQAEDGIRDFHVTGVQTCALPISGVDRIRDGLAVVDRYAIAEVEPAEVEHVRGRRVIRDPERPDSFDRSEERRVGKEWRAPGAASQLKKKKNMKNRLKLETRKDT